MSLLKIFSPSGDLREVIDRFSECCCGPLRADKTKRAIFALARIKCLQRSHDESRWRNKDSTATNPLLELRML